MFFLYSFVFAPKFLLIPTTMIFWIIRYYAKYDSNNCKYDKNVS